MVAILKLILLTYWLVTNTISVALVLITVLRNSLCGLFTAGKQKAIQKHLEVNISNFILHPSLLLQMQLGQSRSTNGD